MLKHFIKYTFLFKIRLFALRWMKVCKSNKVIYTVKTEKKGLVAYVLNIGIAA